MESGTRIRIEEETLREATIPVERSSIFDIR